MSLGGSRFGWLLVTLVPLLGQERELLRDPHFEQGFCILSPQPGRRVVVKAVGPEEDGRVPVWDLAQWNSRFSLADASVQRREDGGWQVADAAKRVGVSPRGSELADLTLHMDSRAEYDRARKASEPWPHLLVQQAIEDAPSLSAAREFRLRLEARLLSGAAFRVEGYERALHCAQCPLVLIVQNRNPVSVGHGDFFWFQVPLFDDRWASPPPHVAEDTADPSAKLIYNPGLKAFTDRTLSVGEWVSLDLDLLPQLLEGLRTAWAKGYLPGSRRVDDYRVTSFILGWEVTGVHRAGIQFRNLSLRSADSVRGR